VGTAGKTLCVHSPGGSTVLREMRSWLPPLNYDIKSKILKNNPAKFHPDLL